MNIKKGIAYCIDTVQVIQEGQKQIAVISGWVKEDKNTEVRIRVNQIQNWAQYRFNRMDVVADCPENRCGFHLYLWLEHFTKNVNILFEAENTATEAVVSVIKPQIRNLRHAIHKKQNTKDTLPFLTSVTQDKLKYCIDWLFYNTAANQLEIKGWAFSGNTDVLLSVNGETDAEWKKRSDVAEAFAGTADVKEECGFKKETILEEEKDSCEICFDAKSDGMFEIHYAVNTLESYAKTNLVADRENKSVFAKIKEIYPNHILCKKYGKEGAFYKKREYEIWNRENELNTMKYQWEEINIPDEYIAVQKKQPLISVIGAIRILEHKEEVRAMLDSLEQQQYHNYELVCCGRKEDEEYVRSLCAQVRYIVSDTDDREEALQEAYNNAAGEWVCVVEQEDLLSPYYLSAFVEDINENPKAVIIGQDYDIWHNEEAQIKVSRTENFVKDENLEMLFAATCVCRGALQKLKNVKETFKDCDENQIVHDDRVVYHYNAVTSAWKKERTNLIAFYLTQYHINEENNKWWGEGFTEWTNVRRGVPMFEGHDQPRVPADFGYYDLVEDRSMQYKQIDLAKQFDIYGFCYYYYWFEGKRLLRKPMDQFLEDKNLDFPFCICWANETWSKRWDGQDNEILMQQVHNKNTDVAFIKEAIPMFKDKRYIRINGKPLLLIYRINLFPEPYKTIQRWKKICIEEGVGDIHVSIVQSFGMVDHRVYGADSSVEFPPHKIVGNLINDEILPEGSGFSGNIYSYKEIVDNLSVIHKRDYNMITGSMMRWDNTARRLDESNIFAYFEPELYRKWLLRNHYYTKIYNPSNFTFVNAWNEWAEGTYLEPDETYGTRMLEISKEVSGYK